MVGNYMTHNPYDISTVLILASDRATAGNTNPIDLTDMVFTYEANSVYVFDMYMLVQSTTSTNGCGFTINLSSAVTQLAMSGTQITSTLGAVQAFSSMADDTCNSVTASIADANIQFVNGKGMLITTSNTGTAQFRFRSESVAVTICKAGSRIIVRKIG